MGVQHSMQGLAARCGDASLLEKPDLLRLPAGRVHAFRDCYLKFQYPPMVDNINLHSYFMNVDARNQLKDQNAEMIGVLWTAFEIQSICYIQEIISCLVLLSEEAWPERLSLLFDIFSCSGGDELGYDDLVMALQVVAVALHRLWVTGEWDQTRWSHVIETLADSAYAKLEKELEASITKEEFMGWATERFKATKTVSCSEDLWKLYSSPFQ